MVPIHNHALSNISHWNPTAGKSVCSMIFIIHVCNKQWTNYYYAKIIWMKFPKFHSKPKSFVHVSVQGGKFTCLIAKQFYSALITLANLIMIVDFCTFNNSGICLTSNISYIYLNALNWLEFLHALKKYMLHYSWSLSKNPYIYLL